jgi:hypothetical protein
MLPGKGREDREEHFAQFFVLKRGSGADQGGGPEEVAQTFGRFEFDGFDMFEREPQIGSSGEDLETGAHAGIGVFERFEWLAVYSSTAGIAVSRSNGIVFLLEQILAEAFGVEGREIEHGADAGIGCRIGKHVEMLLGAIEIALEAQQLEQKRAAPGVGRITPHLDTQRLDCFVQFSGLEQLLGGHERVR